MAEGQVPKIYSWVNARHTCSVEQAFLTLREVVASDIAERQSQLGPGDAVKMIEATERKFIVGRQRDLGGEGVVFDRTLGGLSVKDLRTSQVLFIALPSLTPTGDCMFAVEGKGFLYFWQISRLALEKLFFDI